MIKLLLTSECSECKGIGRRIGIGKHGFVGKCPDCDNGKTVMEFKWSREFQAYLGKNNMMMEEQNGWKFYKRSENITESLNPLFLEVIEEQECPECKGGKIFDDGHIESCGNCTDGRVEVVTQFTVFGSKKEYDSEKTMKGYYKGIKNW